MPAVKLPGLDCLGCGYDVFGSYAAVKSCRLQLFDLGPDDQSVVIEGTTEATAKTYWMPSGVECRRALDGYMRAAWGDTIEEYQASLSVDLKLGGGFAGFTASVSTSFTETQQQKREYAFCTLRTVFQYYTLHLSAPGELRRKLKSEVRTAIDTWDPTLLFDKYGSYYVASLVAGAYADFTCVTDKTEFSNTKDLDVAASAAYGSVLSASVDVKTKETVSKLRDASDMTVQTTGGSPTLGANRETTDAKVDRAWKTYSEWLESIPTNLVFSDFVDAGSSLVPIWELAGSESRKKQLEQAFKEYCLRHTLPSSSPELDITFAKVIRAADDHGLGSKRDLTTYAPQPPDGYSPVGHYAQGNYDSPSRTIAVVRDRSTDKSALRSPLSFTKVWDDHGSGKHDSYSCWKPNAPPGYVALGHVFKHASDYGQPDPKALVCVREDLVTRGALGADVWDDGGSKATMDLTLYPIVPADGAGMDAGAFFAFPGKKSSAPGPQTVYCLRSSGRSSSKDVTATVAKVEAVRRDEKKAGTSRFRVPFDAKRGKPGPGR